MNPSGAAHNICNSIYTSASVHKLPRQALSGSDFFYFFFSIPSSGSPLICRPLPCERNFLFRRRGLCAGTSARGGSKKGGGGGGAPRLHAEHPPEGPLAEVLEGQRGHAPRAAGISPRHLPCHHAPVPEQPRTARIQGRDSPVKASRSGVDAPEAAEVSAASQPGFSQTGGNR